MTTNKPKYIQGDNMGRISVEYYMEDFIIDSLMYPDDLKNEIFNGKIFTV